MKNIEDYWKNGSKKKKVGDKKKSNISIKKRSWTIFESKELKKNWGLKKIITKNNIYILMKKKNWENKEESNGKKIWKRKFRLPFLLKSTIMNEQTMISKWINRIYKMGKRWNSSMK